MKKIRLLLIENNRLLREGISAILKRQENIKVVSVSGNSESTVLHIHKLKPNVVLIDLGLRNQNSLHIIETVKKEFPRTKIIIMDLSPVQADILQYVKAGVSGFILKDATLDDFLMTIRAVAEGVKVLPPVLTDSLFSQIIDHAIKGGKVKMMEAVRMTGREREVIELIADGLTNKEIGQKMHISSYTVRSHIHNIMEKLTLHSRLEIANYSFKDGSIKNIVREISMLST